MPNTNSNHKASAPNGQVVKIRPPRPRKPNYNHVHRNLLPIEIHPLPVLIPHNPLSLIAIALSYFTQLLAKPPVIHCNATFSSTTSSVHVTNNDTMRRLWEMGFFGKGSLSRSEPTWHETQKKRGATSEEHTGKRRAERRQLKLARARKEQEDLSQKVDNDALKSNGIVVPSLENTAESRSIDQILEADSQTNTPPEATETTANGTIHGFDEWKKAIDANGALTPPTTSVSSDTTHMNGNGHPMTKLQGTKMVRFSPTIEAREFDLSSPIISPIKTPGTSPLSVAAPTANATPSTQEHLQLSLEEAFFLSYSLGILDIFSEDSDTILTPVSLLSLFRRHSFSPPRSLSSPEAPDDAFLVSYAAFHHYRSLGWVVRSGVKFSVDYLLYNRGPAFAHAEFSVVLVPSYSHRYWREDDDRAKYVRDKTNKSWWWLHAINRVQAQVMKTLVLCYVEIPPPLMDGEKGDQLDIGKLLSRYKIRDVCVKRWTPNRSRD